MSDLGLGKLIFGHAERDAIHVAVAPVVALCDLEPGEHVSLVDGKAQGCRALPKKQPIGIVDPFLTNTVYIGQTFWLFLYENTVTGMRHYWRHPAFKDVPVGSGARDPECVSKQWLENLASRFRSSYQELVDRLEIYAQNSCGQDDNIQEGLNALTEIERLDMWRHYEVVSGEILDSETKSNEYFPCVRAEGNESCAC